MHILLLTTLLACHEAEPEAPPEDISLIVAEAWTLLGAEEDPWSDGPQDTECMALGYEVEGSYFEVDTELCPYATFAQPALHGAQAGAELTIVYWHLDLWVKEEGTQGHVASGIGDDILVDELIDIPADAEVRPTELLAPRDIEEGEQIPFHLHTRGFNSWSMGTFEALTIP